MFQVSKGSGHLDICLSATPQNIDTASEETKRFLATTGIEDRTFDILLVMREALNNAVKHGSQMNHLKIVKYNLYLKHDYLIMEIEDEGNGFDWRASLRKKHLSTLDRGRGLAIIKEYCVDVTFNDKGNRLILREKI